MPDRLSFLAAPLATLLAAFLAIIAIPPASNGQATGGVTLKGIVMDRQSGSPLPGAHVFIAQSMNGTTTGRDGRFILNDVRRGAKRLYASMLGYEPQHLDLFLRQDTTLTFAFRLPPRVIESPGVLVEAERDPEWHKRLERFERLFLGSSEWASECRIQNPEVLRFTSRWWGKFTAEAAEPLVIENRALGYRVKYFLEEFEASGGVIRWDGEPLFAPITASSIEEADRWRTNRRHAYLGSFRHFLRALLNDQLEEEDFEIYRLPRASMYSSLRRADRFHADRNDILSVNSNNVTELDFHGRIEVIYRGEPESRNYRMWRRETRAPSRVQTSLIELNDPPVRVDRHGKIVEPYGATVYQYFAFERLAELIPLDYAPGKEPTYVGIDGETDVHFQTLPPPDLGHLRSRNEP